MQFKLRELVRALEADTQALRVAGDRLIQAFEEAREWVETNAYFNPPSPSEPKPPGTYEFRRHDT